MQRCSVASTVCIYGSQVACGIGGLLLPVLSVIGWSSAGGFLYGWWTGVSASGVSNWPSESELMENEENSVVSTSTTGHCHGYLVQLDLNQMDTADLGSEVISIKHTNSSDHQTTSILIKHFMRMWLKGLALGETKLNWAHHVLIK